MRILRALPRLAISIMLLICFSASALAYTDKQIQDEGEDAHPAIWYSVVKDNIKPIATKDCYEPPKKDHLFDHMFYPLIGPAFYEQNWTKVAKYSKILLENQRTFYGEDYLDLFTMHFLLMAYNCLQKYDDAARTADIMVNYSNLHPEVSKRTFWVAMQGKAKALCGLGRHQESIDICERLIKEAKTLNADACHDLCLNIIAKNYNKMGDFQKAIDLIKAEGGKSQNQTALKESQYILGISRKNIGNHKESIDDLNNALTTLKQIDLDRRKDDSEAAKANYLHVIQIISYTLELADANLAAGNMQEGEKLLKEALGDLNRHIERVNIYATVSPANRMFEISKLRLGEKHTLTISAALLLARNYNLIGQYDKAKTLLNEYLTIIDPQCGKDSQEAIDVRRYLAQSMEGLGEYDNSLKISDEAIKSSVKKYGEYDDKTIELNLEKIRPGYKLFKFEDGINYIKKIQPQMEKRTGEYDVLPCNALFTLSLALADTGKYNEAIKLDETLIERRAFGGDFVKNMTLIRTGQEAILYVYPNPIDICIEITRLFNMLYGKDAVTVSRDTLASKLLNETLDITHPNMIILNADLARSLASAGKYDEAQRIAEQNLKTARQVYGYAHPCVLNSMLAMAEVYRATGQYEDAKNLDENARVVSERIMGKGSALHFEALEALAKDNIGLKDYKNAYNLHQTLLSSYTKLLGNDNPKTVRMKAEIANDNFLLKDFNKGAASINLIDDAENYYYRQNSKMNQDYSFILESRAKWLYNTANELDTVLNMYKEELFPYYESRRNSNRAVESKDGQTLWAKNTTPKYKALALLNIWESSRNYDANKAFYAFYLSNLCKSRNLVDKHADDLKLNFLTGEERHKSEIWKKTRELCYGAAQKALLEGNIENYVTNVAQYGLCVSHMMMYDAYLAKKYPEYADIVSFNSTFYNPESYRENTLKALPEGAAFIDFSLVKKEDFKFLTNKDLPRDCLNITIQYKNDITKGGILPLKEPIEDKIETYRNLLSYPNLTAMKRDNKYLWKLSDGVYKVSSGRKTPSQGAKLVNSDDEAKTVAKALSKELGNQLLQPLAEFFSKNNQWIISPDSFLNMLPFETLEFNGEVVGKKYNVSYVPSMSVMQLMVQRGEEHKTLANRKTLFAMGNPIYSGVTSEGQRGAITDFLNGSLEKENKEETFRSLRNIKWANLPGTEKELKKVSSIFKDNKIYTKKDANESNLKKLDAKGELKKYKYMLFATHGLFVPRKPDLSSIVLSQGVDKNEDGYMTIGEWMGCSLKSDLIYLSACESGLGDYQAGEGIVGIPYALTLAGNKDTVMSLWKVDDEATAAFTSSVFEKLKNGKSGVNALSETKREFMNHANEKYRSPSVWAAFVLYGI